MKLKETEIKYIELIENIPDVAWTKDQDGNSTFISPNVEKIYGYNPEEIYSSEGEDIWFGRIYPDDVENIKEAYKALFEQKSQFDVEYRIKRKDGTWIWLYDRSEIVYEKEGVLYADGVFSDVTQHKSIEVALKESEEKFRTITEQSFLGVVIIQDNLLKYVNKAISIIYGYSIEEMLNWPALELFKAVHPEDRAIAMERVRRKVDAELADSIVHPYRVFTKSGELKWVESYSRTIQYKGKNAFLATILDVTEKKEAEQKLIESEEKYRGILDNIKEAYFEVDLKGNFTFFNDAFIGFIGYTKNELLGVNYRNFVDDENKNKIFKVYNEVYKTSMANTNFQFQFSKSKGDIVTCESSVYLRYDSEGNKIGFNGVARDITEKFRLEQKVKESEEKFRLAFENAADAIIWADVKTGLIINCNKKAEILLEKKKEEIIGLHQTTLHPPDMAEQYAKMFKIHIEQSGAFNEEASVITKSGKIIPVHITASVTLIGGESIIQGIFRDISKH